MQPDESNYEFLRRVVHATPGWLVDFTAILTMDLLAYQASQNARGSLLEIGVFQGRYFAILLRSALRTDSRLVGVDTFQYIAHDIVEKQLRDIFNSGMSSVTFVKAQSTDLTPVALLTLLGQPARFISIDGSHEKDDVYLDLALSDELLGPAGIIAVDDFLNPLAIGVNEAVNLYFRVPRRLVPSRPTCPISCFCRALHPPEPTRRSSRTPRWPRPSTCTPARSVTHSCKTTCAPNACCSAKEFS